MRLAIMQPYFFPYVGYFQLIQAVDKIILHDGVDYIKKGWMNRNRLRHPSGEVYYITAPVRDGGLARPIREVQTAEEPRWRGRLLAQVHHDYRRAPYYGEVFALLERALALDTPSLARLNARAIALICEYLALPTQIAPDASAYDGIERELRALPEDPSPPAPGEALAPDRKSLRILKICQQEGATGYVNAIGGQALYDQAVFARHGVELRFIRTLPHSYPQGASGEFVPHLSILDVLMHCGPAGARALLDRYELI